MTPVGEAKVTMSSDAVEEARVDGRGAPAVARIALCKPSDRVAVEPSPIRGDASFVPLGWGRAPFEASHAPLLAACQAMVRRQAALAKDVLGAFVQPRVGLELSNEQLLGHLVAEPLLRRVDRRLVEAKNIYLQRFDIPQIELFYQMKATYPQVSAGHDIANQFHAHALAGREEVSLFEIGIGKGAQVVELVEMLARQSKALRCLRVFALDPDIENLRSAANWLRRIGERLGVRIPFYPMCAQLEDVSVEELRNIRRIAGSSLVINSAFALHHTSHDVGDHDYRTRLLSRLACELQPELLTLVEPNANHDTEHLPARFDACWRHFGTVFELIDESGLSAEVRLSIKERFFGREIRDIFGSSDRFRSERHESIDSWLLRLDKAGLVPYEDEVSFTATDLPEYCDVSVTPGLVRLGYRNTPLIAVFAARASGSGAVDPDCGSGSPVDLPPDWA
jgi:hypothetical protein